MLSYRVLIQAKDGVTYNEESTNCNGADATIMANLYCLIPMAELRQSDFNLVLDDLVVAKVIATNQIGDS